MSGPQRVAFYAPLKSPNHPSPSGDRTMARLLMKALGAAGFSVFLASEMRTLDKGGDPALQEGLRDESEALAAKLTEHLGSLNPRERPALWFTYHVYYKAPDWIGPRVAAALGIPYVIAEGSRSAKRAQGPWALGHAGAEAALDRADAIVTMTARDRIALEAARPARQILVDLPPFIDPADWGYPPLPARPEGVPRLLTVAMMREGDKLASYRILAAALAKIGHLAWTLDIVGDGEARGEVGSLFASLGPRIRFHGQMEAGPALRSLYERADLFVWPAVNEAYGMVLLEAQLLGCPVVAGDYGGVASVVKHDATGCLVPPGDAHAFAGAVAGLIGDRDRRLRLGEAAYAFIDRERGLDQAGATLRHALGAVIVEATS